MLRAHSSPLLNSCTPASSLLSNHLHHPFHTKIPLTPWQQSHLCPSTSFCHWRRDREHLGGEMRDEKSEETRNKPGKSFTPHSILLPPRAEYCCCRQGWAGHSLSSNLFGPTRVIHHVDPLLATPISYLLPGVTALLSACPFGCSCQGILFILWSVQKPLAPWSPFPMRSGAVNSTSKVSTLQH